MNNATIFGKNKFKNIFKNNFLKNFKKYVDKEKIKVYNEENEGGNMLKITLKEMLEEMVNCILNNKELNNYYWKDGEKNYHLITEVDLMYRIRTANDDFTEFEWELKESNLYKEE